MKKLFTEILVIEKKLLQPEFRKDKAFLNAVLADDFIEISSSGNIYNKKTVVEHLSTENDFNIDISDIRFKLISENVVLILYAATKQKLGSTIVIKSLRSSIWQKNNIEWQMIFHQGTASRSLES